MPAPVEMDRAIAQRSSATPGLLAGEHLLKLAFEFGGGPDVAVDDLAAGVDQDHRRQGDDPVLGGEPALLDPARLEDLRPGQGVFLQEGVEPGAVVVEVHADDREVLAPVLLVELDQLGEVAADGVGPARPEGDQEGLPLELARC